MRTLPAVGIALTLATQVLAQTYVTDDITWSTIWSPGCSPYIIQANVEITNDSTLSIEAGVTVAFDGDYMFETDWGSAIIATGEAGNPILFTSNGGTPAQGDWKWVQVSGPNPSSFDYCTFEFAETGLRVNVATPTVTHCTIRSCLSSGLFCAGGSPTVQDRDIYANRDGIGISGNSSNPIINYNNIHDNTHWNVYVFSYPEPAGVIDAEDNWWGTDVGVEIANEVYDSADNPIIFVTIDYDPWWSEQPVEEATWGSIKALFGR